MTARGKVGAASSRMWYMLYVTVQYMVLFSQSQDLWVLESKGKNESVFSHSSPGDPLAKCWFPLLLILGSACLEV